MPCWIDFNGDIMKLTKYLEDRHFQLMQDEIIIAKSIQVDQQDLTWNECLRLAREVIKQSTYEGKTK